MFVIRAVFVFLSFCVVDSEEGGVVGKTFVSGEVFSGECLGDEVIASFSYPLEAFCTEVGAEGCFVFVLVARGDDAIERGVGEVVDAEYDCAE